MEADAELYQGDKKVGVVTQPALSPVLNQSIALIRIDAALAKPGEQIEVRGPKVSCTATTHGLPFYNPDKTKRSG